MHQIISFIKSGFRIQGLVFIIYNLILIGLVLLLIAEVIGVMEELYD